MRGAIASVVKIDYKTSNMVQNNLLGTNYIGVEQLLNRKDRYVATLIRSLENKEQYSCDDYILFSRAYRAPRWIRIRLQWLYTVRRRETRLNVSE